MSKAEEKSEPREVGEQLLSLFAPGPLLQPAQGFSGLGHQPPETEGEVSAQAGLTAVPSGG